MSQLSGPMAIRALCDNKNQMDAYTSVLYCNFSTANALEDLMFTPMFNSSAGSASINCAGYSESTLPLFRHSDVAIAITTISTCPFLSRVMQY